MSRRAASLVGGTPCTSRRSENAVAAGSDRLSGGGKAGSGGYDYQARVIAYVAAHILAQRRLDWIETCDDAPVAVSAETGGAGDDLAVEFPDRSIEAQVKHGLDGTELRKVIAGFATDLTAHATSELLLIVDGTSTKKIYVDLAQDLRRLAGGRRDLLKAITRQVIGWIEESVPGCDGHTVAGRIRIIRLDLEGPGAPHEQVALDRTSSVVDVEHHRRAWSLLLTQGHLLQKSRGRVDRGMLLSLLQAEGIEVHESHPAVVHATTESSNQPEGITADSPGAATDPWNRRIDEAANLIRKGRPSAALGLLQTLAEELHSAEVAPRIRYRILANQGASLVDLGRLQEAEQLLLQARDYEGQDVTARIALAQVYLARGDRVRAIALAEEATTIQPRSVEAWATRVQASKDQLPLEQVPEALRQELAIGVARALVAWRVGNVAEAIGLLREALQRKRDPQILLLLSKALLRAHDEADVGRYLEEAATGLASGERHSLMEQTLILLGQYLTRKADREGARRAFERALAIPGHSEEVELSAARSRLAFGEPAEALGLLAHSEVDGKPTVAILKALCASALGRTEDASLALQAVPQHADADSLLGAAEAALHAGLVDEAKAFLNALGDAPADFRRALLEARLARQQNDPVAADEAYVRAAQEAGAQHRSGIQVEHAAYLAEREAYPPAVALYEQAGALQRRDLRKLYARALYKAHEISKLMDVLCREREDMAGSRTAVWALELEARVALERQDWPGAIKSLEALHAEVPGEPWVAVTLAQTLLREHKDAQATTLLLGVVARADVDPEFMMGAADLLSELGRAEALPAAYRAVRARPDDPRLRLAYIKVFLQSEKDHALRTADTVGPGTWVRLKSARGETREYLILAGPPADLQRGEVLPDHEAALKLMGLKVGEHVVFRAGAPDELDLEVEEVKTAEVRLFQQSLTEFRAWFPENTSLQSFRVGDERLDELTPIIASLQGRANHVERVFALYAEKGLPLAVVAKAVGGTSRSVYEHLSRVPGRLLVQPGDAESVAESADAAAKATTVVLDISFLVTLQKLGRLDHISKLFGRLVVPQALIEELEKERRELSGTHGQAAGYMAWAHGRLVIQENDAVWQAKQLQELDTLRDWIATNCERRPRPIQALNDRDEGRREQLGDLLCDTIAVAAELGGSIAADDLGLRMIAQNDHGLPSFNSVAALQVAQDRDLLTHVDMLRDVSVLVGLNHDFVPISADMLYQVLSDDAFQVTTRSLVCFDRLRGDRADTDPAVRVAVLTLKRVGLSVGGYAFDAVADLAWESLTAGRDASVYPRIKGELTRQFALAPTLLDRAIAQLKAFIAAKALAGQ